MRLTARSNVSNDAPLGPRQVTLCDRRHTCIGGREVYSVASVVQKPACQSAMSAHQDTRLAGCSAVDA